MQKILVIGRGGREAAMCWKLAQSPNTIVLCAPGNAGIEEHAVCVPIDMMDFKGLLGFVRKEEIDLTVVGPEKPLVAGIVDWFRNGGVGEICGPGRMAALITEGSKVEFKKFLQRKGIPTAPFEVFTNYDKAIEYVRVRGPENIVIKADGLMAGKGVFLPDRLEEAEVALRKLMVKCSPGGKVLVEDRLYGIERSVMAITDGINNIHMLPFTQDYKRLGNGDTGPNTGGMGAHTLSLPAEEALPLEGLMRFVVGGLGLEGCYYTGFIYLGVIITTEGPKVIECNCRLGDPETQVILPSLNGDFAKLCMAATKGGLGQIKTNIPFQDKHALCVALTSSEYPDPSDCDDPIAGIPEAEKVGAIVFHAGTGLRDGEFTTKKSDRILNVVGVGNTITEAQTIAYGGAGKIKFPGIKFRDDIGGVLTKK